MRNDATGENSMKRSVSMRDDLWEWVFKKAKAQHSGIYARVFQELVQLAKEREEETHFKSQKQDVNISKRVDLFRIPKFTLAQAGAARDFYLVPPEWEDWVLTTIDADKVRGAFAVEISGDSMEPLVSSGDIIIAQAGLTPGPGDHVVAYIEDDGAAPDYKKIIPTSTWKPQALTCTFLSCALEMVPWRWYARPDAVGKNTERISARSRVRRIVEKLGQMDRALAKLLRWSVITWSGVCGHFIREVGHATLTAQNSARDAVEDLWRDNKESLRPCVEVGAIDVFEARGTLPVWIAF
jgi:hypothetical protein